MECLDVDLAMRCKIYLCKNPARWNMVIRSWQLQYPCQPNEPNGCKTFMRGFMGLSGKAQSAGREGEVLFSVPWTWLVVFVFFWFWWWCWWWWWWCLRFFSSEGGLGASPLIQVSNSKSNSNMTPDFIAPNTANRYRYVVLYATLVKFHLTFPWVAWTWSLENVCSLRKYPIDLNKKGAAAPTSRPILYMRTVSSTVPIYGILKTTCSISINPLPNNK